MGSRTMSEPVANSDDDRREVYPEPFATVNAYLARFGREVDAQFDRLDPDGYTDVRHGEVLLGINVVRDPAVLLLLVRMTECPKDERAAGVLFRRLLELNFLATQDCAFAIDETQNAVYLRTMRGLQGLDYEEFRELLQNTAAVAEELGEQLKTAEWAE